MTLRIGLLVNPIAGIGGPAGMKGSDAGWQTALDNGAVPTAPARARRFVQAVGDAVSWVAPPGALGGDYLDDVPRDAVSIVMANQSYTLGNTAASDTRQAAKELASQVDLLCFFGGDGTATDVAAVVVDTPCLGVPAGVKITSEVFTHDVEEAAWLVANLGNQFETTRRDVTDLDESAYQAGRVETKLTGSLTVPLSPAIQGGKVATTVETPLEPLVEQCMRDWDSDATWLVGAGSVCREIKKQFWGTPTLLGIDAIRGDRIIATDLDADAVDALVAESKDVRLLLSTIGGQGMLLGRGTQILRPATLATIGWNRIHVIAPPEKLLGLRGLYVDSGDPLWDEAAPTYLRVTTGWNETRMIRLLHGAKAQEAAP